MIHMENERKLTRGIKIIFLLIELLVGSVPFPPFRNLPMWAVVMGKKRYTVLLLLRIQKPLQIMRNKLQEPKWNFCRT